VLSKQPKAIPDNPHTSTPLSPHGEQAKEDPSLSPLLGQLQEGDRSAMDKLQQAFADKYFGGQAGITAVIVFY